jgi:hypothetical protein
VVQGTDARGRRHNVRVKMEENNFKPSTPADLAPQDDGLLASADQNFVVASKSQMAVAAENTTGYTLKGILLKDVEIMGKADMVTPFSLHRRADVVINSSQLPPAPSGNIMETLQGRVAGLHVYQTGRNDFRARIRGQMAPPLYLIDGMPVSESALMSLNQFDISRIEILKSVGTASIYGGRAGGGVIAFFTKRGGEESGQEVKPGNHIIIHRAQGLSKVREFYSPRYDLENPGSEQPDLRTTLYWNPSVQTDAKGKATVTFYTADRNTTYRAIAEGISDAGKPGRGVMTFGVNRGTMIP